ncbi:MAG: neuromedin U [Planctomycetota bacterium]
MKKLFVIFILVGMLSCSALGQEAGKSSATDLAKQVQNPVADLISLPFQNNTNFETGLNSKTQNILNIQPIIPFNLNEEWNVITRTILPVIYQPEMSPGDGYNFGLGDTSFTTFLSPTDFEGLIWGVGPAFQLPTHTDNALGTDKWGAGPSVVIVKMDGPWVYGFLVNQIWSFAGDSSESEVSTMMIQQIVNYNLADGWYLTSTPIHTANWKADSDEQWTIPVGGGIGRVFRIGHQPINMQVQGFYNVEAPDSGADWQLRFQVQLMFPKEK